MKYNFNLFQDAAYKKIIKIAEESTGIKCLTFFHQPEIPRELQERSLQKVSSLNYLQRL